MSRDKFAKATILPTLLTMKCKGCLTIKMISDFSPRKDTKTGYSTICKACIAARQRQKRADQDPAMRLYEYAKRRAIKRKRDFDILPEDLVVPAICPVLGTPMRVPSVDRINPLLGYVKGNVRVISHRANMLRNNATYEEMQAVLADTDNLIKSGRLPAEVAHRVAHDQGETDEEDVAHVPVETDETDEA
jgi:hypothetical protein